jgi:Family of unknown function (DUF6585)
MRNEPFPPRVRRIARRSRLGAPVRAHDSRGRALAWVALLGLAGVVLVPAGLSYLDEGDTPLAVPSLLLAAAYLGGAGWILGRSVLDGRGVYLYERGFVRAVNPPEVYAWDDLIAVTMAGLRRSRRGRTAWLFTVVDSDDREVTLGGEIPDVGDLGEVLVAEVTRRLVPWYVSVIADDGTVELGPFTIGLSGIAKDGDLVPWEYVDEVVVSDGVVYVRGTGGQIALAATVGQVPNVLALAAVAGQVLAWHDAPHYEYGRASPGRSHNLDA